MARPSRIGIIGNGNVGTALSNGLERAGYEVQSTGKEPERVREVAKWAEAVILAVPYGERRNALREAGTESLANKTLVDATNALGEGMAFAGPAESSGAQEVAGWAGADCSVVKAFNTVFAQQMDKGVVGDTQLTLFCAGDDPEAKSQVLGMGRDLGFDAVDAGPLENARFLESLGYLNIALAHKVGLGPDSGFRYVHQAAGRERPGRAPRGDHAKAAWHPGPETR
ncbi:MAG: NADPH-dependent F420 reductase [Thermoplasmatota archaeon]|nr:NAD(P)-binding domain-containing protein [Halobacteriales archaeon]